MNEKIISIPRIIAHRGANNVAPENTIMALNKAHELGAKWVEFDVMMTRDGIAIVHHDWKVNRTTNGKGFVRRLSYHQIEKLDAGSWFEPLFKDEKIPSLNKWLERCAQLKMGINLEMKATRKKSAKLLAEQIAIAIKSYWNTTLSIPLLSSFSINCLQAMREQSPDYLLGYVIDRWRKDIFNILDDFNCVSLHLNYKILSAKRVELIKSTGRKILAYTVNDKTIAKELFDMGVDAIFTDNLVLMNEFL